MTVIFQNTNLLAFHFNTQPLFVTIGHSSAELWTTDRVRGTITPACQEGEILKLVRQTHKETICRKLRGSPPLSTLSIKATTNLSRISKKVTVNSMQYLF